MKQIFSRHKFEMRSIYQSTVRGGEAEEVVGEEESSLHVTHLFFNHSAAKVVQRLLAVGKPEELGEAFKEHLSRDVVHPYHHFLLGRHPVARRSLLQLQLEFAVCLCHCNQLLHHNPFQLQNKLFYFLRQNVQKGGEAELFGVVLVTL